jgi:hypothetical protein
MARQFGIQTVRLVGVVADETRWELADKSLRECGVNLVTSCGVALLDVDGDRAPCRSAIAMIFRTFPVFRLPTQALSVGRREAAVDLAAVSACHFPPSVENQPQTA